MKKFLLLQLFALVGFVAANAHNLGDYVYTSTAKYKVVSMNMIRNNQLVAATLDITMKNAVILLSIGE